MALLTFLPVDRRFCVVSISFCVFCRLIRLDRMLDVREILLIAMIVTPYWD